MAGSTDATIPSSGDATDRDRSYGPVMPVNLQKMLGQLDDRLGGRTVGHSVAIYKSSTLKLSKGDGTAIVAFGEDMSSHTRMDCLSMSKTVTAAAVLHALLSADKSVDTPIKAYLPKHWKRGTGVDAVTFRQLLTHTGGLPSSGLLYEDLEDLVAGGVTSAPTVQYTNSNYALFRILLPYLVHGPKAFDVWNGSSLQHLVDDILSLHFIAYVQKHVFGPCGVEASAGYKVLLPAFPVPGQAVWYKFGNTAKLTMHGSEKDAQLRVGSDYWNLSVRQFAKFADGLRSGKVFGPQLWTTMRNTRAPGAPATLPAYPGGDARLGVWRFAGAHGSYYGHNGGWTESNGSGAFTGWMAFPDGVTAAFYANSAIQVSGLEEQEKMLLDAHDAAWE
jgi:CubicO group peptidase (beta-lactamase class C family)